jgi:DNA-binding IclR family transcriptional regulator
MTSASQGLAVLERGFKIIEVLRDHGSLTLTELADEMDLPQSTAHIYLSTLRETGYVTRSAENRYRPSLRFLELGGQLRANSRLFLAARNVVDSLAEHTGEHVSLGIEEDGWRVILYNTGGEDAVHDNDSIGNYEYMHITALGLTMLAHMDADRVDDIIEQRGLPETSSAAVTDRTELQTRLTTIRERGFAIENEERHESVKSIARAIVIDDTVEGAIALTGPARRFTSDTLVELDERLQEQIDVIRIKSEHYP